MSQNEALAMGIPSQVIIVGGGTAGVSGGASSCGVSGNSSSGV